MPRAGASTVSRNASVGGGDAVEWYTAHRPPVGGVGEGEDEGEGEGEGEVVGVGVPLGVGSPDGRPAQT